MPLSRDNFDGNSIYRIVNNAYTTSNGIKTSIQRQIDALTSASANYLPATASANYLPATVSANYLPATASANYAFFNVSTNSQGGNLYTLVITDAGRMIEMSSGTAATVTVPADATTNFPIGTKIDILRTGAGEISIAGATSPSTVTVSSEGSKLRINAQWQAVTLIKRAANTWVLVGALKA